MLLLRGESCRRHQFNFDDDECRRHCRRRISNRYIGEYSYVNDGVTRPVAV